MARCVDAGTAALPYGFAAAGLALGAGAVVTNNPLPGACGAVAGVTAGLLSNFRTRAYRDQTVALRERLRLQRLQSEGSAAELRSRVSALEVTVWERKFLDVPVVQPLLVVQPQTEVVPVEVEPAAVEQVEVEAATVEQVEVEPVAVIPAARPGLRLAQAAARINVPKLVLDAAVATTGSLSLAAIAAEADAKAAKVKATQTKAADAKAAAAKVKAAELKAADPDVESIADEVATAVPAASATVTAA